jgi:hypothetical protein
LVLQWREKARLLAARLACEDGRRYHEASDMENAMRAYSQAFEHIPDYPPARDGIAAVAKTLESKQQKADAQYLEGIRSLAQRLFPEAYYHMFNVLHNDPTRTEAQAKQRHANMKICQDRLAVAKQMQAEGFWAAALSEYKVVQREFPEFPEIAEGIAAMQLEIEAQGLALQAEMLILRGRTSEARAKLEQAYELSHLDRVRLSESLLEVKQRELEIQYDEARDLEFRGQLAEALAIYQAVEALSPGFKATRTYISTLEETIQIVEGLYEEALAAETSDPAKARDLFRQLMVSYPDYKDAKQRLARIDSGSADG